ncbi:MAG: M1 family metallopeptidase [Rhodothermales bacterium]|nr:M1 family metallopeptidase [Rhodothermales bacterium]
MNPILRYAIQRSCTRRAIFALCLVSLACDLAPSNAQENDPYDSGGILIAEQAVYDVTHYDLELRIDPDERWIGGTMTMQARMTSPANRIALDLDPLLTVKDVSETVHGDKRSLDYEHTSGRIWITLGGTRQPGQIIQVAVSYEGNPRVAPNPPWDGGFSWSETADGFAWIATSCQTIGADVWWPVKDHVTDEPDSMSLHITVPDPLVVASNGRLQGVDDNGDSKTYHWFSSNPINVYNVALNIAPYRTIETDFQSVAGETFPVVFYVLPEDFEKGQELFPEILDHLKFYEEIVGPYPFRADKYGVAQTPHLGMEHQTIIAYGANFDNGSMTGGVDFGYDALHHHELAHEWWGNLVTNVDWSDMWLHEGFGSYMQPLYREYLAGPDAYHEQMARARGGIRNQIALAPRGIRSSQQIYTGDIYTKGAWLLHTLRYLIGDDALKTSIRRMAYPTPAMESATDGSQTRFASTDDYKAIAEDISGRDLDWFFEVYARQPALPRLSWSVQGASMTLRWETPNSLPFPMPIDIEVDGSTQRVEFDGSNSTTVTVPEGASIVVDPLNWVLKDGT